MKDHFLKIHRLKLTTVTPVCIGGDQDNRLSPYADYVVSEDGQSIHYIDKKALENAVDDAELMDEYVTSISTGMDNNRSSFDLKAFITGRLEKDFEAFIKLTVPNYGISASQRVEFQPIAKSAGRAYLPGSSVKGAIRTAMLYDWLVKSKSGESIINSYYFILRRYKNREINFRDANRELLKEDKLFGSLRDQTGQDSRRIRVSDSSFTQGWEVHDVKRIRLRPSKKEGAGGDIPMPREAISPNVEMELDLNIEPPLRHDALKYLNDGDTSKILKRLNHFTLAALRWEMAELNASENRQNQDVIDGLWKFYDQLLERAKNGETFLRLGAGKTIYDNSLALAIYNGGNEEESEKAFNAFRRMYWRVKYPDQLYPITRTVTKEGVPMGWVKVEGV